MILRVDYANDPGLIIIGGGGRSFEPLHDIGGARPGIWVTRDFNDDSGKEFIHWMEDRWFTLLNTKCICNHIHIRTYVRHQKSLQRVIVQLLLLLLLILLLLLLLL